MSTYFTELELVNWKCFRGEHKVPLAPGLTSVVARRLDNDARSNWLGKTTFLQAMNFLLTGEHGERLEDDWISTDAPGGKVCGTLSNGAQIRRTRRRGKSTQVEFSAPGRPLVTGAEAEVKLRELTRMSPEEFNTVAFFGQAKLGRLIDDKADGGTDPSDRMVLFSEWFGLAPLQRCWDRDATELRALTKQHAQESALLAAAEKRQEDARQALAALDLDPVAAREQAAALRERERAALAKSERRAALERDRRDGEEFERVRAEGVACTAHLKTMPRPETEALRLRAIEASTRASQAAQELRRQEELAVGAFDGQCPLAHQACPSASWVAEVGQRDRQQLERAREAAGQAARARDEALGAEAEAGVAARALLGQEARLAQLRTRATTLLDAHKRAKAQAAEDDGPGEDPHALLEQAVDLERRADHAAAAATAARAFEADVAATSARLAALSARMGTLRESCLVFSRGGAQRRVAEGELGQIEAAARKALAALGSGLSLSVTWGRPVKGQLAPHCDACGSPFADKRAQKCGCGAERGPKLSDRLDITPSRVSGGAKHLCGLIFGLASWAWLRRERGSEWGAVFLDEPFGALDRHHRRELTTLLPRLLEGVGVAQAFLVAHEAAIAEAAPARVSIVSDDGMWSRFE